MQYTTNYGLKEPQYADEADIEKINENTEAIDNLIHQNRTMIAPAFDNTKAYVTGDPVEYLGALYVFTSDKAAGAWDASKVEPTTAAEMGGGGASALADLDDVEITSPTDGQALLFDDSDDKWKNGTLPDPSVTKTATGNPIEITDAADAQLVKCVTAITGSQDLHGYDKPWVGGAGKNKSPMTVDSIKSVNSSGTWSGNAYTLNDVTFTILTDSAENVIGIKVYGLANATVDFIPMNRYFTLPANSYILNGCSNGSSSTYRLNLYKVVSYGNELITQSLNGDSPSFTLSGDENLHSHMYISQGVQVDTVIYPMIRLSTEADSTFAPYSNICPITAYTEGEIEVRGHNVSDEVYEPGYINITTGANAPSTTTKRTKNYIKIQPNTQYCYVSGASNSVRIVFYGKDKSYVGNFGNNDANPQIFTTPNNAYYLRYYIGNDGYAGVNYPKTVNTYEPYVGTTHTTTFPSAIYRGSEDVVGGSVEKTWGVMTFDGSENWEYSSSWSNEQTNVFYCTTGITDAKYISWDEIYGISNLFEWVTRNQLANATAPCIGYSGSYGYAPYITVRVSKTITDVTSFKSFLNDNNMQIAYELTTHTTTPVTPTNLPIKSLSGYNHIESSTGEMEIEYITKTYEPLVELIQSSDHIYSTQEQVVGTWIDGKDLYERTIIFQNVINLTANAFTDVYDLSTIGVESLVEFTPYTDNVAPLRPFGYFIPDITSANMLRLNIPNTGWYIGGMTIRYTKTTATRSLSAPVNAQKSISEPLTDKTEEVPTEEENAVEEKTEEENEAER